MEWRKDVIPKEIVIGSFGETVSRGLGKAVLGCTSGHRVYTLQNIANVFICQLVI